jgi:hypothetical protein
MTGSGEEEWAPFPGVDPARVADEVETASKLEVDGEIFALRPDGSGGTHYGWISGPNPGYGFSVSPTPEASEQHRRNIRNFLSMIDPATGYIDDE